MASDYNFVVVVYDGPATAQAVFNILKDLEKDGALDVKEAAVLTRAESGKIKIDNQGYIGTGKGGVLGLVIGALAVSAPLAGLLVGGLIGFARSGDRRKLKGALDEQLGPRQSALAVVIKQADWERVVAATEQYPGEIVQSELSDEALATLEGMAEDEDVSEAKDEAIDTA